MDKTKHSHIFFDLDGTLTDPKEGITNSVAFALNYFNIKVRDLNELDCFIGPPLKESFMQFYKMSDEDACMAVKKYRERFRIKGMCENKIYPGVEEMLCVLKNAGKTLAVVTSKPTVFSEQIIDHFQITKYFSAVIGSELDGTHSDKSEVIKYALSCLHVHPFEALMVGDRKYDVIGAKQCDVTSVSVAYGYAEPGELKNANSDYIVDDIAGLTELLQNI
jgi:phosphoglycolate phosphatase